LARDLTSEKPRGAAGAGEDDEEDIGDGGGAERGADLGEEGGEGGKARIDSVIMKLRSAREEGRKIISGTSHNRKGKDKHE